MDSLIEKIGRLSLNFYQEVGEVQLLFWYILKNIRLIFHKRTRHRLYEQILKIGADSVTMVSILGAFVGMVLALQMGYQLKKIGGESFVGAVVALSLVRELAPVFTGYLIAGRIGAAITAEIGTMNVNDEIDALRAMGIDPIKFLAFPRIVAGILVLPVLVVIADIVGIIGGGILSFTYLNVSVTEYKNSIINLLVADDILEGLFKAAIFGAIVCVVGCHQGFKTTNGAQGVGKFTTRSVVISFIAILVFDYFLSRFLL